MSWNTVIFDLDGTLLNSLEDIRNSTNYTMRRMGFPEKSPEEIKAAVGNGVRHLLECCLPRNGKENEAVLEKALGIFKEHYFVHSEEKTIPYEGAEEALRVLYAHKVKMAIVSNKPDEAAQKAVKHFFGGRIAYTSGEKEGVRRKPAPDLIQEALRFLKSDAAEAVYVGDSEVDVLTAQNAGLSVILVSWGYRDRKMLESFQAEDIVDDFDALCSLILGHAGEGT